MNPYVLTFRSSEEIVDEFKKIGVDWGGMDIMRRKAFLRCLKIVKLPNFSANILKQEMLSLGGDAALSRGSLTGKDRESDCILLGTPAQISGLCLKLKKQPFGLSLLSGKIRMALDNFENSRVVLKVGSRRISFGEKTFIMGIVNATPDSFSGDGFLGAKPDRVLSYAKEMVRCGADMIDIGGESTRPGSRGVSARIEAERVLPFVKVLAGALRVPVSIDTSKSEVAHRALDLGATIVNDISALRFDKKMAKLVARYKASLILMHMKGTPRSMQEGPQYYDVMEEVILFLEDALKRALDAGVAFENIAIDPGIGFGKSLIHNLEIIDRLRSLKALGRPILVGLSRKSFIGKVLKCDNAAERIWGTAAAISAAIGNGADIVRVHDVKEMAQVAKMADIIARGASQKSRG